MGLAHPDHLDLMDKMENRDPRDLLEKMAFLDCKEDLESEDRSAQSAHLVLLDRRDFWV